jgi:hypothetical protein
MSGASGGGWFTLCAAMIAALWGAFIAPNCLAQGERDLAALGIRRLEGKHIELFTDLPSSPEVDELPAVFDAAVPQLEAYFSLPPKKLDSWRVRASVLRKENAETFHRAGLLPRNLPPFLHGFARGRDLWVYEQPSDYYRRHLLLHEGVHALMAEYLGGMGPPWYAEGMAELLATHHWNDNKLTLRYFPKSREEAPEWGRVKLLRDAVQSKTIVPLEQIFAYDHTAHRAVAPYAWSWAAATFLESHPRYGKAFAALQGKTKLSDAEFNAAMREAFAGEEARVAHEWQSFVSEADYGCDVARTYLIDAPPRELGPSGARVTLRADLGWQSTGVRIEAGKRYEVKVTGRYVVRGGEKQWESEPQGITVHYFRGQPMGMAMGAVLDDRTPPMGISPLLSWAPLGPGRQFQTRSAGVLYLRVNEPAAGLVDNEGEFTVEIVER